ncbi:hypothetical protein BGY98DRAFT_1190133 [Russula aff. rugulosa BPL654]|nr:hypothetical protein BGY98DRAFT_1190133 [Russula aff. rugulosa BPL654]
MNDGISQGVDKTAQDPPYSLLPHRFLIADFPTIHSGLLAKDGRGVVQGSGNTALVGHVCRLGRRGGCHMLLADEFESITLPGGTTQVLGPVDLDAFSIFEDLCLLDNRERLQLEDLHTTFVLELIKRVLLTNYHQPTFPQAFEIVFLLQHRLFPLLSKTRSERSAYQPPIRDTHVVFLLFKQFSSQLEMEAELIPQYSPNSLMVKLTLRYDALATDSCTSSASSARVFTSLISVFRLLVTSRPTLLGVSAQMHGVGVAASDSRSHLHSHHSSDSVVETVTMAASGTGTIGTGAGLSAKTAAIKVQCIDDLDKADAPLIPEASIHLLGCNTRFISQRPHGVKTERAGRATNPTLRDAEALAPLYFLFTTNLSDSIFGDDLGAMQAAADARAAPQAVRSPGLSPRNLVFQDAEYVLTTRGAATPGRVLDYLITQLAKDLQQGSQLLLNKSDDEFAHTRLRREV